MRDPEGFTVKNGDLLSRHLKFIYPDDGFLRNPLSRELVDKSDLVDFHFTNESTIESPVVPFVTYPYEWCDEQFRDAALHTLALSNSILGSNFELKDASAWNIIFENGKPIFCTT